MLAQAGAESIDAAREEWWVGLRDAEEETYRAQGRDFKADEAAYRRGFELALNPKRRGKSYEAVSSEVGAVAGEQGRKKRFDMGISAARIIRRRSQRRTRVERTPSECCCADRHSGSQCDHHLLVRSNHVYSLRSVRHS